MIRLGTNKDIAKILELGNTNFNLTKFSRKKLLNKYCMFLYDDLSIVKAYLIGEIISEEFHVYEIFIGKQFRGCNIGSLLMEYIINFCKKNNIINIYLETGINNFRAQRLYLSKNFVSYSIRNNYYVNGEDAINYIRRIHG